MPSRAELERALAAAIGAATGDAWRLQRAWLDRDRLLLAVEVGATEQGASLALEVAEAAPGVPAHRVCGGFAFSYRGKELPSGHEGLLGDAYEALAEALAPAGLEPWREPRPVVPDAAAVSFPTPYQRAHLDEEAPLAAETVEAFRRDGHVLVRRALHPDVVKAARPVLLAALERHWPSGSASADTEQRDDAYSRSFTQITDRWPEEPALRAFGLTRRIARMAADLMGVERARLFCEDWLIKEPHASITPWHQDGAVMPFEAERSVTCWIPLQAVGQGGGLMRFARGSHRIGRAPVEDINDRSEEELGAIIAEHGFAIDVLPPVFPGDVSFHHGFAIHGAFPNEGEQLRAVLALHCFADGARIVAPSTPKMARLLEHAAPGSQSGDEATSERWPALPHLEGGVGVEPPIHLRATLLPRGGEPVDLWIEDGRLRLSPGPGRDPGSETLVEPGGYLTCGLVESHGHISYPTDAGAPVGTDEWMNARRADYAATGVTLIRDMGAVSDAISERMVDVPGLPRVHPSGTMILPEDDPPFTRTGPGELVRAFAERIERGARWVKVFADWTSDFRGRENSGFTEHDEVSYPAEHLAEAVRAAHELGGRVGAHCFTRAGAAAAIAAGVDSLEHGWGVDEELLERMSDRGIAWAPLVGIAPRMWQVAVRDGQPQRAEWIERTMESLARILPLAEARGIQLLAGTDMFPEVTVADEVAELHALGVSEQAAVASAFWEARSYLGERGPSEGAPADLVLYRSPLRPDARTLLAPELVLIGGERVTPSLSTVRPAFIPWSRRHELLDGADAGSD